VIPKGIILAVLDCDADSVEAWNRWYDLEHTPPNVWLPGVMLSRRYVAPPELHEIRVTDPGSALANQHGTFITVYTVCEDPAVTVAGMSTLRDKLYAEERMNFPPEKKVVRDGDALTIESATSAPELKLPTEEVPFVGHTGVLLIQRTGSDALAAWYREEWAPRVVSVTGVHGIVTFRSGRPVNPGSVSEKTNRSGHWTDMVFFEGDAVAQTRAIRERAPHHANGRVLADAPFLLIDPLRYPWAEAIRNSSLPRTVASPVGGA
jgi:hypothetical protein